MKKEIKNRGITLIALVITIIVLLILAGVTITMLTGENGIITKANTAKIETDISKLKEELSLAQVQWNMEEEPRISLKDFLLNTEKSGLKNLDILDQTLEENGENTLTGIYKNHLFIKTKEGNIEVSKGENLVRNGMLEEKNNSNFKQCQYKEDERKNGYFSINTSVYNEVHSSDFIEVDTSKKYFQSITAKSDNSNAIYFFGIQEFDQDGNLIETQQYRYRSNTLTYLEKDLQKGDTQVFLNSASNFSAGEDTAIYEKGFIFWNYMDLKGKKYPESTYSRNVYPNGYTSLFEEAGIDRVNNIITLKEPWEYETIKKGEKLSQKSAGNSYNYGVGSGINLKNDWQTTTNYLQGENNTGTDIFMKFRPGTKYIRMIYLMNYHNMANVTSDFKNVIFLEI